MSFSWRYAIGLTLILILAGALFFSSLHYPFVWDDTAVVRDNPFIHSSTPAGTYFTPRYWANLVPVSRNDYRPLQMLTLAGLARFGGPEPFYFRGFNFALHLLTVVLVFLLGRRLGVGPEVSLLAAALFAFHPIHVETIIGARNLAEQMATVLLFAALLCFLRRKTAGRVAAFFLFAAALLYKENALVFPPLLLILSADGRRKEQSFRSVLIPTLPFWLLAAVGGIGKLILSSGSSFSAPQPLPHLAAGASRLLVISLRLLTFPFPLRVLYHFPRPESWSEPAWFFSLAAVILLAGALVAARKSPLLFSLGLCLTISLLPSIYRLHSPGRIVAEQRLYLPSFFFLLITAILIGRIGTKSGRGETAVWLTGWLLCLPLLVLTGDYLRDWNNELRLWNRVTSLSPRAAIAFNNLGNALSRSGDAAGAQQAWEKARRLAPRLPESHTNLGILRGRERSWEEAVGHFQDALAIQPSHHPAALYLAQTYRKLRREEEAVVLLRGILEENPDQAPAANELAIILERRGQFSEAEQLYRQAAGANPGYAAPLRNLAELYQSRGEFEMALATARAALAKRPDQPRGYVVLAKIHIARGELDQAREVLTEAARRYPRDWRIKSRLLALDTARPE